MERIISKTRDEIAREIASEFDINLDQHMSTKAIRTRNISIEEMSNIVDIIIKIVDIGIKLYQLAKNKSDLHSQLQEKTKSLSGIPRGIKESIVSKAVEKIAS